MKRFKLPPDVSRFAKVALLLCTVFYVGDYLIGRWLAREYRGVRNGVIRKTTFIIEEMQVPYLVFGSSRASRHYKSAVFASKWRTEFYNCGRDGQEMIYAGALAHAVLSRYKPRMVILDVLPEEFSLSEEGKLGALLPYAENKAIRPFLDYNGQCQQLKLLSGIYPYNSMLSTIWVGKHGVDSNEKNNGYLPLYTNSPSGIMKDLREPGGQPDKDKISVLENLLAMLEQKKIHTVLVISPLYKNYGYGQTVAICKRLSEKFRYVEFLNFTNLEMYRNRAWYADDYHLNDSGATAFSIDLANRLDRLK